MKNSIQEHISESFKGELPKIFAGVVRKVYNKLYKVDVEDMTSGKYLIKVPIASPYAGTSSNGTVYGMVNHPTEGDIVVVALINGSSYDPVVIGMLYTQVMQPPVENQDDFVYLHKSGTKLKIAADGSVSIIPPAGKTVTIGSGTSVNSWFDSHKHMTADGPSGTPMTPSPSAGSGVLII